MILQGYLTKSERDARNLADGEGHISPSAAMDITSKLNKTEKKMHQQNILIVLLVIGLIAMGVALGVSMNNTVNNGNTEVKAAISDSVSTSVGYDTSSHPHLKDKQTGLDMTVRAGGDSFVANEMYAADSGRKLFCISLADVALMEDDMLKQTLASMTLQGNGTDKQIIPLAGKFKDEGNALTFANGEVRVILDSLACESALQERPPKKKPEVLIDKLEDGQFSLSDKLQGVWGL